MSNKYFADRAVIVDGVLREWGDRIGYKPTQGRKAPSKPRRSRNIFGGTVAYVNKPKSPSGLRSTFLRTIKKTPEVMVKIKNGGMSLQGIQRRVNYIGRNGAVEIEDQRGDVYQDKEDFKSLMEDWQGYGIPKKGGKRREAFHIILSMPAGTDRQGVKDAASEFAHNEFNDHKYVFAFHDDEPHPHVHLILKATSEHGKRLNPRKKDLQAWREHFAEKLREQGIEANATPRRARGVIRRQEKQAVLQMDKKYQEGRAEQPSKLTQSRMQHAKRENGGHVLPQPFSVQAKQVRHDVIKHYGTVAKAFASGDAAEQQIALQCVDFVQTMPEPKSKHDLLVQRIRSKTGLLNREQKIQIEKK